jgi:hypothetical protein
MHNLTEHAHGAGTAAPELAAAGRAAGLAPLGTAAAAPAGLTEATKDEARTTVDAAPGFKGQGKESKSDCADDAATVKRFATLRARLALAGWALTRTEAGADSPPRFYASRWNMARELADLAAVDRFADRVGAPK